MFCFRCGVEAEPGAVFCQNCGARLLKAESEVQLNNHDKKISTSKFKKSSGFSSDLKHKPIASGRSVRWYVGVGLALLVFATLPVLLEQCDLYFFDGYSYALRISEFLTGTYIALGVLGISYICLLLFKPGKASRKKARHLTLPEGLTKQDIMRALGDKFNYPYYSGVRHGGDSNCVIDGRYASYTVDLQNQSIIPRMLIDEFGPREKRLVQTEAAAIRDYLVKFMDPTAPNDTVKALETIESSERKEKYRKVLNWIFFPSVAWLEIFIIAFIFFYYDTTPAILIGSIIGVAVFLACFALWQKGHDMAQKRRLPDGATAREYFEALNGHLDYPYCAGILHDGKSECVVKGKYADYALDLKYSKLVPLVDFELLDPNKQALVKIETIIITNYIIKLLDPSCDIDPAKSFKVLQNQEKTQKVQEVKDTQTQPQTQAQAPQATAPAQNSIGKILFTIFSWIVGLIILLVIACAVYPGLDEFMGGYISNLIKPGYIVRTGHLTNYSKTITVEEAFDGFFADPAWDTYKAAGRSYIVFTGKALNTITNEDAYVRITFKSQGKFGDEVRFSIDNVEIDGVSNVLTDLATVGLLERVYEKAEQSRRR